MASSQRRPAPIANDFSRDKRVVVGPDHAAGTPTMDSGVMRIGAVVLAIGLLWAVDAFVFDHALSNGVSEVVTPTLRQWQWAWTTYWRRGA